MQDGAADPVRGAPGEREEWCALLAETRQALAHLRADELQELAARAECRLRATLGEDWIRQRIPSPATRELPRMARQHRLLRDLLRATRRNVAVLQRLRERGNGVGGNGQWVR